MNRDILIKAKEATKSVMPIILIVLLLSLTIAPINKSSVYLFLGTSLLVIFGLSLFTMGADVSMLNIGERVGSHLLKTRDAYIIAFVCFLIGVIVTVAEPDLSVLASQVPMVPNIVLIISVAVGVGIFLLIAALRVLFQIKLSMLLLFFYLIVFTLAAFVPNSFIAVAFDSGGVTTGPMTVPFIMALGVGLASVREDATSEEDTFGFVALASIGPILTVLILGILSKNVNMTYQPVTLETYNSIAEIFKAIGVNMPNYFREVSFAMLPLLCFYLFYERFFLHSDRRTFFKICFGLLYVYVGLVVFLFAVNFGFMPMGYLLGKELAAHQIRWLIVPIGAIIGYFMVSAEPAVIVLKRQVEEITEGKIKGKTLGVSLAVGVALSVSLAMIRVLTGISIWYMLVPGYLFSLLMMFFVPPIFTAISFDSGGVASGPMTATFLLPFAIGAAESIGGDIVTNAFGIVAMVAMIPLITIQALGIIYNIQERANEDITKELEKLISSGDQIVNFEI